MPALLKAFNQFQKSSTSSLVMILDSTEKDNSTTSIKTPSVTVKDMMIIYSKVG